LISFFILSRLILVSLLSFSLSNYNGRVLSWLLGAVILWLVHIHHRRVHRVESTALLILMSIAHIDLLEPTVKVEIDGAWPLE